MSQRLHETPADPAGAPVDAHVDYLLALGDDALIASQRLAWWVTRAPELEEDVALANIALDLLGQARGLLSHAGRVEGRGRDEDTLAYFRDGGELRNVCLVERSQTDFAVAVVRLLLLSTWQCRLYEALTESADATLAALAGKAVKEVRYHRRHAATWVLRLGDGTAYSHDRVQAAVVREWPWAHELFDESWLDPRLVETGIAVSSAALRSGTESDLGEVLTAATLAPPDPATHPPRVARGRHGRHTEELGPLLGEMQHLARSHPGARW